MTNPIIEQLWDRIDTNLIEHGEAAETAADRAEAEADRAEAAAEQATTGIADGAVTRPKLSEDVVAELEGKADTDYVDGHLASSTRSGISLLPMVPGTHTPMWAASFREVTDDVPPGEKVAYANNEDGSSIAMEWKDGWVKVAPRQRYRIRIWLKADTPGSGIVFWGYGDDGSRGIEDNTVGTSSIYPIWVRDVPTEWTLYEGTLRIREGVTALRVGNTTWNHSSSENTGAVQYVSGFEIWPDFAPGEHAHTSADITDATSSTGRLEHRSKVVKTDVDGHVYSYTDPTHDSQVTRKRYVDGEVETRTTPDTVATMISQAVAGLVGSAPDALDTVYEIAAYLTDDEVVGGLIEQLSQKAETKHTHTTADLPTSYYADSDAETMKLLLTGSDGFLHSRTDPTKPSHLVRKAYVDAEVAKNADKAHTHAIGDVTGLQAAIDEAAGAATWGELQGKPSTFPPASHTHTSADITDTVYRAGTTGVAKKVISTSPTGRLYYDRAPGSTDELTNKEYVDQEVAKKANTSHTHSVSDVSDLPKIEARLSEADTLVQRDANGRIAIRGGTSSNHAVTRAQLDGKADKSYVDERIQLVTDWPSNPVAGVLYLMEE